VGRADGEHLRDEDGGVTSAWTTIEKIMRGTPIL
jgi:hypothetical protein